MTCAPPRVKQPVGRRCSAWGAQLGELSSALGADLEGGRAEVRGRLQAEGTYVRKRLIHIGVQQK